MQWNVPKKIAKIRAYAPLSQEEVRIHRKCSDASTGSAYAVKYQRGKYARGEFVLEVREGSGEFTARGRIRRPDEKNSPKMGIVGNAKKCPWFRVSEDKTKTQGSRS